jgi:hypothetical protein
MSITLTRNILVPGWIATFGFAALWAPPLGVAASLALFAVGVFVVPMLLMIPGRAYFHVGFWRIAFNG